MSANRKIILITGVTRGLGAAMTEKFIELGHTIWGCGRSQETMVKLQEKWTSPHDFTALDVSQAQSVKQWAEKLLATGQIPDLIINNAGIINTEMLESAFGSDASQYLSPQTWARIAIPFLLQLTPDDNGRPMTIDQH